MGFKNSFLEYEYGTDAASINTVINKNKLDYSEEREVENPVDIDYDSVPTVEQDAFDSIAAAYQDVYGKPLSNTPKIADNDISAITPNENYKDDDDLPICK